MEVLIAKWRKLGEIVLVFYNNSMAVADDLVFKRFSKQMHCDLLIAGLVPGVYKCIWEPGDVLN